MNPRQPILAGRFPRGIDGGQQHADEDADDGNHHQQFHQREAGSINKAVSWPSKTHGICSLRIRQALLHSIRFHPDRITHRCEKCKSTASRTRRAAKPRNKPFFRPHDVGFTVLPSAGRHRAGNGPGAGRESRRRKSRLWARPTRVAPWRSRGRQGAGARRATGLARPHPLPLVPGTMYAWSRARGDSDFPRAWQLPRNGRGEIGCQPLGPRTLPARA